MSKTEDLVRKMFSKEAVTLSLNDLEGVAGGVITEEQAALGRWGLGEAKKQGMSMDDVLKLVPAYYNMFHSMYPDITMQEAIDFIKANWNSL